MKFRLSASLLPLATLLSIVAPVQAETYFPTMDDLAGNPRSMCKTEIAMVNHNDLLSTDNSAKNSSASHSETSHKHDNNRQTSAGGGGKFGAFGFSIGGNGKKETKERNSGSSRVVRDHRSANERKDIYSHDRSYTEAVAFEQADCDGFLEAAATVEAARLNTEVQHHAIEAKQQKSYFDMLMEEDW